MDIETKLKYLQWQTNYTHTKPYRVAQFGRKRKNNGQKKPHNLVFREGDAVETIRDIRGTTETKGNQRFTLDINGFVYSRYPPPLFTNPKDFGAPDHIQNIFLPECEAILRNEIEGVDQVFIFDWKVSTKELGNRDLIYLRLTFHLLRVIDKEEEKRKRAAKEER